MASNKEPQKLPPLRTGWVDVKVMVPPGFAALVNILQLELADLFTDLMRAIGDESTVKSQERAAHATAYFTAYAVDRRRVQKEAIGALLSETQAVAALWPDGAPMPFVKAHARWRKTYYRWLVKKWRRTGIYKPLNPQL